MPDDFNPQEFLKGRGYSDAHLGKVFGTPVPTAPPKSSFIPQKEAPATTGGWRSDTPGAIGNAPTTGGWTSDEPGATPAPTSEPAAHSSPYQSLVHGLEYLRGQGSEKPRDEDLDLQQRAGKGVARGLATDTQEALRLAQHFNPEGAASFKQAHPILTDIARQLRRFSEQPSTSWAESIGELGGESLPTAFVPMGKGAKIAGDVAERMLPKYGARAAQAAVPAKNITTMVPKYVQTPAAGAFGPGQWINQAVTQTIPGKAAVAARAGRLSPSGRRAVRFAKKLGTAGEIGAHGALGGVLADPEHPGQGAEAGAAGAVAGKAGSKVLRSKLGQHLGDLLAREGTYRVLHDMFGIPYYPLAGPLIIWRSSPIGKTLHKVGGNIMDSTGRIIGAVNPMAAGMATSRLMGAPGTSIGGQMGDLVRQIIDSVGRGRGTPTPDDED